MFTSTCIEVNPVIETVSDHIQKKKVFLSKIDNIESLTVVSYPIISI